MIFRQLFEPLSSTYTYLLGCESSGAAVLVDPVVNAVDRDLAELQQLGLTLAFTLDTHLHADHITGALQLKQRVGSRIASPAIARPPCTDVAITDRTLFRVGSIVIEPRHTPGHTDDHFAYVLADRVFTGDALLIDGCGRTDFQNGSAKDLYRSVHEQLFTLPDDFLVYPAHDYHQRRVSTIGQEKLRNPRLGAGRTLDQFERIMDELHLPYPRFIDHALPANRRGGVCPIDLPAELREYCGHLSESAQG